MNPIADDKPDDEIPAGTFHAYDGEGTPAPDTAVGA